MNKKLRIFLCSLISVLMIFAVAVAGCDSDTSTTSSDSSTTTSTNTESTGSENTGSGDTSETHTHTYDYAKYEIEWADDMSTATVTVPCTGCDTPLTVTATITSAVKSTATKLAKAVTTYTATFTLNGTEYTVTKDIATTALATVYDAYYIDTTDATAFVESDTNPGTYTVAEGTTIFGGFATTSGKVTLTTTAEESSTIDGTDYNLQGYLRFGQQTNEDNTSNNGKITFTLEEDAVATIYIKLSKSYPLCVYDETGTALYTFQATTDAETNVITAEELDLDAGTYSIGLGTDKSLSGVNLYAIMLDDNAATYTEGIWNYSEPVEELEDNQFKLTANTEYTFTAAETGYYTFSIPEDSTAVIWKSEADYNADPTETVVSPYLDSGEYIYSFEEYIEAGNSITMYSTSTVIVTYEVSDTSGSTITTYIPDSLSTGSNTISLSAEDADTGLTATFKASTAGTYKFSTSSYNAFMTVGSAYVQGAGSTVINSDNYYTVELDADETVTIYFYTSVEGTAATYTLNIELTATSDAYIPSALVINGNTEATLDADSENTNEKQYMISYTVETAGYYTFTLSGTDLTYVDVTIYDRDGGWTDSSLTASKTSVTLLYGVGDTIKVYAQLLEGAEGLITFSLNTVKESTALTSTINGTSSGTLATGEDANLITLSSSDGSTYGNGYSATFTASETGYYTFKIEYGADAQVEIDYITLWYISESSTSNKLSVTYYLTKDATLSITFYAYGDGESVYDFYITYSETVTSDYLTLNNSKSLTIYNGQSFTNETTSKTNYAFYAYATYTPSDNGNYNVLLSFSSTTYVDSVSVTVNGTAYELSNYHINIENATAGTTYNIVITYALTYYNSYTPVTLSATVSSGSYTPVTTSVNSKTDSDSFALKEGDNTIALSATDCKTGVTVTFTVETLGVYKFEIASDADAKVTVGSTTLQSSTLTTSVYLAAGASVSVTLKTYSSTEGTYTLKITKSEELPYEALTLGTSASTTAVTRYTNGATKSSDTITYMFVTYTVPADATETKYYISLSSSSSYWNSSLTASGVTISVNGGEATASNNYNFNLELTAGQTYNFVITVNGTISNGYYMYVSLYAGEYTPLASSINANTENANTLVVGDNAITVSSGDASGDGYVYSNFTASKEGIYTFTVNGNEDGEVYIATSKDAYDDYNYSRIYSYNTEASVILSQGDTLYIVFKTYSGSEGSYSLNISVSDITKVALSEGNTTLTLIDLGSYSYAAYATFTATDETAGNYYITISSTDSWFDSSYVTSVTINGKEASGESLSFNTPMVSGTNTIVINFYNYYFDSSETYKVTLTSGSVKIIETELPETLSTSAANEVSISASDAAEYWGNMPTKTYTLAAGTYTLSITSGTDAYVYCLTDDYTTVYGGVYYYTSYGYGNTEYEFTLDDETTLTFKFSTASGNSGTYVFYLTKEGEEEGGGTGVAGVDATINIGSLVSEGTVSATEYTSAVTLYTGTDGTKVVVTAGDGTEEKTDSTTGETSTVNNESVIIESNTKSYKDEDGNTEFSSDYRLKLGGAGASDGSYRSIEITTVDACTITVYMISSSSSASRTVNFSQATTDEEGTTTLTTVDTTSDVGGSSLVKVTYTVSAAGTYYIATPSGGLNVYGIIITYTTDSTAE